MVAAPDVSELRRALAGEVLSPSDPGYEEACAIWNGVIDRRPAVIARCTSTADVVEALRHAREHGLGVGIRGGGHNVAGHGTVDGGLLIDLSPMRDVRVDHAARLATVGGGATLGDVDAATQVHGLAASVGVVSETGIAGLTLSGGMGWLRRRAGLSCDQLVAAEVVTADGSVVTASEDEHADLLWGLRGGGGNFGVVTSFVFRLFEVGPEVAFAFVLYPAGDAKSILAGCRSFVESAPEEAAPLGFFGRVPVNEAFPEAAHGEPFVAVACVHTGTDPAEGERVLRPLRELGEPIADLSGRLPYVQAQGLLDEDYPKGRRYYWKSTELTGLGTEAIEVLGGLAEGAPSDLSTVDIWFQGGAMARVAADATAYGDRSAPILIGVEANWEGADDEANIAWARGCIDRLAPFSTGRSYLNFPGFYEEQDAQVRTAYGQNYERLVAVKTAYDPDNVFRVNQNIAPSAG